MQAKALQCQFMVRLYRRSASFHCSPSPLIKNGVGSLDLKVKVSPCELLRLAKGLGGGAEGSRIMLADVDPYNRLLVYAAIRPTPPAQRRRWS